MAALYYEEHSLGAYTDIIIFSWGLDNWYSKN